MKFAGFRRQRTGSVVCPSCGRLVGASEPRCPFCGRPAPAMFGLGGSLRKLESALSLWPLVGWICGAIFIATLVTDPRGPMAAVSGLFTPSGERLVAFGASGAVPVFQYGRWWTVLSANWLHGNLLHIGMNMLGLRQLAPAVEHLYGTGRAWIIYTVSGVIGFAASTASVFLPVIGSRGGITIGASAALMGLLGALLHYSRRGGSRALGQMVWTWALATFVFGLLFPGIDNWAHLGGFAGGWLISYWLDPLKPERVDHLIAGALGLLLSLGAVVVSLLTWSS
ncbi:MAG TPA: rhomboid family intramembrane serine protease [Thermoanaerobaculia bacterium]|nr:rhomboid family intramembrane serine protease [Thermoanaerobaculia bacterium]